MKKPDGLRQVRFVDTPGLESVLAHNTELLNENLYMRSVNLVDGQAKPAQDALLAGLAGYGLLQALLFVGRSHPYNIYHVAVPFVLVVVVGAARLASRGPVRRSVLPVAALAVVALWLLSNPQFAVYPALLRVGLTDPPRRRNASRKNDSM